MNYEISGGIEQKSSVYEKCPVFENDKFLLRFANKDDFNGVGVLRMDVGSHYEESGVLQEILPLVVLSLRYGTTI